MRENIFKHDDRLLDHQDYYNRWTQLKSERESWFSHCQELSDFIMPMAGRFVSTGRNDNKKKTHNILDNTATRSLHVLGAGMMAGASSPARPWFNLGAPDPEMNRYEPVKIWLHNVTELMRRVFNRSNTYRALHQAYEEIGCFGTHANIILPNYKTVIHNYSLTAGEYCLATDFEGNVNTLYREFQKTVYELVKEFGIDNVSDEVAFDYQNRDLDRQIKVIHAIEPRTDRDYSKQDAKNMPYASVYFEESQNDDKYLRVGGFNNFRVTAPRWGVVGGDVYGSSPGMEVLGDVKQLQHEQRSKAIAIDYQVKPSLQLPTTMKNKRSSSLPGGVSYYDATGPNSGIRKSFEVSLELDHLLADIRDVRERIRGGFYADLFLMLANATDTRMTATEVAERHEEKLLMLGPVMERLHNELLEPLIDITFQTMADAGMLPPPPPELEGVELNVEFISMLAQAQKAIGVNAVDRYVGNLAGVAGLNPNVLDKFDADAWADEYADSLGVNPKLIISNDRAMQVRETRAAMQAEQAKADAAQQQATIAKDMSAAAAQAPEESPNVIDMFSGYNS